MALAAALEHYDQRHEKSRVAEMPQTQYTVMPELDTTESPSSSVSSSPKPPSLTVSTTSTSSERPNEHLAVLLPKNLWKPDSLASVCDNFYCRGPFTMLERRHHCRKCGGIYCASCSSRTTPLLDCSKLDILHPQRNEPLSKFESPTSPIRECRVCDDCWDQIWGNPHTPRTPDLLHPSAGKRPGIQRSYSNPIDISKPQLANSSPSGSGDSSLASSIQTPPQMEAQVLAPSISRSSRSLNYGKPPPRTASPHSPLSPLERRNSRRLGVRTSIGPAVMTLPNPSTEPSYGALDAYPLRRRSLICKATGGGRWEPRNDPPLAGYRVPVPGSKAAFEVEMEEEEAREKEKEVNRYVRDGDFQYRFVCSPRPLGTFH